MTVVKKNSAIRRGEEAGEGLLDEHEVKPRFGAKASEVRIRGRGFVQVRMKEPAHRAALVIREQDFIFSEAVQLKTADDQRSALPFESRLPIEKDADDLGPIEVALAMQIDPQVIDTAKGAIDRR
jgi:hypothetical protein